MGNQTALLVMDMQLAVMGRLTDADLVLVNTVRAIDHARERGILVVFVKVDFRMGGPEISLANKIFAPSKIHTSNPQMSKMMEISPALGQRLDDIVVAKKRVSAFSGSDLEILLRSQGIQDLVLCGVSSSGVVLSTLREAADRDYSITVLSDCCGDADQALKVVLEEKVFPMQATVSNLSDWILANSSPI